MKLQLNDFIRRAAILICGTALLACNNLDELEQRVDSLESRIQALETQLPALNENVTALSEILESGNISSVSIDEETGEVTITTTGGNTYTFTQGSVGNAPQLSVDDEGYWIVSYDNWETEGKRILDENGDPVLATSSSIVFGVSDDGYWEISYDGGEIFVPVYKEDGTTRIPALEEDSDFFTNIVYDEENQTLTLTLSDGKEIVINVVSDFLCQIQNITYGEAETFSAGETRDFTVTMRGVATAEVTVPSGWKATLSDVADETATLSVTAPADGTSALTKITADTESDVTITAVSEKGLTAMSKMTVALSDAPAVSISAGEATSSTLTFTVTPNSHVTSFKYLLYDKDTAAPTDEAAFESATEVTTNLSDPITLDRTSGASEANLSALTTYVLYVLPVGEGTTYGSIRSCEATTAEKVYETLYEAFMDGQSITIGENVYTKNDFAEENIIHVTEGSVAATNDNIYFIGENCTISSIANQNVILIGDKADAKPTWTMSGPKYLTPSSGEQSRLVIMNIEIDGSSITNYLFTVNADYSSAGSFGELVFDNCKITMNSSSPFYSINGARYLDKFVMVNCDVQIPAASSNRFMIHTNTNENNFSRIVYKNNIFYCPSSVASGFRLVSGAVNENNKTTIAEISVENNTLINAVPSNSAMIIADEITNVTFSNNILYTDQTQSGTRNIIRCNLTDGGAYPSEANGANNFVYDTNDATYNMFYQSTYVPSTGTVESPTIISSSPFSTLDIAAGTYTLSAQYSQYGAQRD